MLRLVFKSEDFVAKDFESYVSKVEEAKPSVNSAFFTGHTTLRMNAMGENLNRAATKKEIDVMKEQLELALCQGSIGLSTGLFYEPANAAPTAEVIELAKVLESYGGIYATHMRDEADFVVESVAVMLHRPGRGLGAHWDNAVTEGTGLVLMVSITCGNDGVPRVFRFTDPIHGFEFDVETRNGQLVVFGGRAYDYWRHESVRNKKQTSTVISLTMRLAHVCGHNQTAATQEFKPGAPNAERVCHERVRASMQAARGEY